MTIEKYLKIAYKLAVIYSVSINDLLLGEGTIKILNAYAIEENVIEIIYLASVEEKWLSWLPS